MPKIIFSVIFLLSVLSQSTATAVTKDPPGMILIPLGEFKMGSKYGDKDEIPIHTVYLEGFLIDQKEVTNREYREFTNAKPKWQKKNIPKDYHDGDYLKLWPGNNYPKGLDNHPVVYVSWYAAQA